MDEILAITKESDSHVPMVQKHLDSEIVIFDATKFPDNTDITYDFQDGRFQIYSEGRLLSGASSVWFRKPNYLEPDQLPVEDTYQQFAHEAYKASVKSLYDLMREKFWLSDYRRIMEANNKLMQLERAYDVGFLVPSTMVTSKAEDAESFRRVHGDIIAKSLSITPIKVDGDYSIFFTTRIGVQDDVDLSGLSIAPAILQQEIKDKKDIRVTIVGNDIFPCLITPKETISDEVDWRVGINSDEVNYEPFPQFPEHLRNQCLDYLNRLGLAYGVVEFALDQQGGYWFLEINPNGQWGFIEEETGMEISKSIARILRNAGKK